MYVGFMDKMKDVVVGAKLATKFVDRKIYNFNITDVDGSVVLTYADSGKVWITGKDIYEIRQNLVRQFCHWLIIDINVVC